MAVPDADAGFDWEGVRLHVVTGKGGTGKTTVAASLALALATGGKRVLLIEVEGRQGLAQVFDTDPLPHGERKIATATGGGEVHALAIDIEQALLEYLEMFYRVGRAGKALKKLGAIDFATTIAPGVRDVLLTGKAIEAVKRKDGSRPAYDAVVMDAPPTGRITRFLNVNTELAGLARFGPIHSQAQGVMRVLKSPATAVHLVTLLEEMPVQETVDGTAELREAGLPVGGVFVNMVRPPLLDDAALAAAAGGHRAEVVDALLSVAPSDTTAGAVDELVDALLDQAVEHAERAVLEREQRAAVQDLGLPWYELPLLADGVDTGGLYQLARILKTQGAA